MSTHFAGRGSASRACAESWPITTIKATFFFSVGPDNMGRHLWRLLRPTFLWKMLRTKAASLYGWDILLQGNVLAGPAHRQEMPGRIIRAAAEAGHEIGLHAWDHHAWQAHIDTMDAEAIRRATRPGCRVSDGDCRSPAHVLGRSGLEVQRPRPGGQRPDFPFELQQRLPGREPLPPGRERRELSQPQVPVTLPTYDEVDRPQRHHRRQLQRPHPLAARPDKLNVLTIHAEVEGILCRDMFAEFVQKALSRGHQLLPLGALLGEAGPVETARMEAATIPGREGWVACQTPLLSARQDAP